MTDNNLLQRFVEDRSEAAFDELVRTHKNFVYSVCHRIVGDADLASDVTQAVFLLLAEKAQSLSPGIVLSGWLFRTAHFASRNAMRAENNRRYFERKAAEEMMRVEEGRQADWGTISPNLDDAIARLNEKDRDILMLRYAEELSLEDTGRALGVSTAAAQRRASRAIERLRGHLAKGGIVVSAAALTFLLSDRLVEAAPASVTAALPRPAAVNTTPAASATATSLAHTLSKTMAKELIVIKSVYVCSALAVLGALAVGGHFVLAAHSGATHHTIQGGNGTGGVGMAGGGQLQHVSGIRVHIGSDVVQITGMDPKPDSLVTVNGARKRFNQLTQYDQDTIEDILKSPSSGGPHHVVQQYERHIGNDDVKFIGIYPKPDTLVTVNGASKRFDQLPQDEQKAVKQALK